MTLLRACVCLLALGSLSPFHAAEPAAKAAAATPPVPTVIESDSADMVSTEKETTFTFRKNVRVSATNMSMTCDELVVVARRAGDPSATIGKQQSFKSLVASGGVRIVQEDREATAARAEVFPDDDKVVLSGDPVVRNEKDGWEQTGPGMNLVLHRGQRRAVLEGPPGARTRLILPGLKDLGYDKDKKETPPTAPATNPAAQETTPPPITVPIPSPITK